MFREKWQIWRHYCIYAGNRSCRFISTSGWKNSFLFLDSLFSLFFKAKPLILFAINLFMILLLIIWEFHIIHPYHTHFPVLPGFNIICLFIFLFVYPYYFILANMLSVRFYYGALEKRDYIISKLLKILLCWLLHVGISFLSEISWYFSEGSHKLVNICSRE